MDLGNSPGSYGSSSTPCAENHRRRCGDMAFAISPPGNRIFRRDLLPFLRRFSIAPWREVQITISDIASSFRRGNGFSTFRCCDGYLDAIFGDGFFGLSGSSRGTKANSSAQSDNEIDSSWGNIEGRSYVVRNGSRGYVEVD